MRNRRSVNSKPTDIKACEPINNSCIWTEGGHKQSRQQFEELCPTNNRYVRLHWGQDLALIVHQDNYGYIHCHALSRGMQTVCLVAGVVSSIVRIARAIACEIMEKELYLEYRLTDDSNALRLLSCVAQITRSAVLRNEILLTRQSFIVL